MDKKEEGEVMRRRPTFEQKDRVIKLYQRTFAFFEQQPDHNEMDFEEFYAEVYRGILTSIICYGLPIKEALEDCKECSLLFAYDVIQRRNINRHNKELCEIIDKCSCANCEHSVYRDCRLQYYAFLVPLSDRVKTVCKDYVKYIKMEMMPPIPTIKDMMESSK